MKHTKSTCPKKEQWFVDGGRCGWAWECNYCEEIETKAEHTDQPIEIPVKHKKKFKIDIKKNAKTQ